MDQSNPQTCQIGSTSCKHLNCLIRFTAFKLCILEKLAPLVNLGIRLFIAWFFFNSGMIKLSSWDNTLFLFENEYNIPLLPFKVAACMATVAELALPVLLLFGFGTRIAAAGFLVMIAVIEYTYMSAPEHRYLVLLLLVLIFHGAGKLSLDYWLRRKYIGFHLSGKCKKNL